jgi:hypothetical protein
LKLSYSPISIGGIPNYLIAAVDIQASRRKMRKQDFVEEAIDYGLGLFRQKRQSLISQIEKARNVLYEESGGYAVHKIFISNSMALTDGPEHFRLGYSKKKCYRISSSLDEEISKLSELLGIPKSFLFAVFLMFYLVDCKGVPNSWKKPMITDCQRLLTMLKTINEDIRAALKRGGRKEDDNLNSSYIFKGV